MTYTGTLHVRIYANDTQQALDQLQQLAALIERDGYTDVAATAIDDVQPQPDEPDHDPDDWEIDARMAEAFMRGDGR